LTRAGDRFPFTETMIEIMNLANSTFLQDVDVNYEAGRTSLCELDHNLMQSWVLSEEFNFANQGQLTQSGYNIVRELAQTYQQHFPTLLPTTYNDPQFFFRTANAQRHRDSGRAFAEGLFGAAVAANVTFEPIPEIDWLLSPSEFCPNWPGQHDWNREAAAFDEGVEMRQLVVQLNQRLGFIGHNQLSMQTIRAIWDACRHEKNSNLTIPQELCAVFSIAHNQLLEYQEDLSTYNSHGYGNPQHALRNNLPCGLIQDMLNHLTSTTDENTARIYITDGTTMLVFLSGGLQVFDDEESITRHNFEQQGRRLWRSSWLNPKATNLAVIRYDCPDGDHDVLFLFNERPLFIPGCQLNGLCKVNFILNRYQRLWNANCAQTYCSTNV